MGEALVSTHGEGLQYLVQAAVRNGDFEKDAFTMELLWTLCVPVVSRPVA
jgi:hypothetical protein